MWAIRSPHFAPGVANTLAAVDAGVRQVECTINGIGERAGNAALDTLDRLRLRAQLPDAEVASRRAKILEIIATLELVEVDAVVLDRAAQPMPTELGTLDAIHLATALLWKEMSHTDLTMATHDTALGLAARAHGLPVVGVAAV